MCKDHYKMIARVTFTNTSWEKKYPSDCGLQIQLVSALISFRYSHFFNWSLVPVGRPGGPRNGQESHCCSHWQPVSSALLCFTFVLHNFCRFLTTNWKDWSVSKSSTILLAATESSGSWSSRRMLSTKRFEIRAVTRSPRPCATSGTVSRPSSKPWSSFPVFSCPTARSSEIKSAGGRESSTSGWNGILLNSNNRFQLLMIFWPK